MYQKLPNGPLQQKRPIQNLIPGFQFVACYLLLFLPSFLYMVCKRGSVGSFQEQPFQVRNLNLRYP
jgi:hypothetical protein